ncbi:MAG: general secretion pathway protein I [Cryomorphaceae bacterium]|jgi:general secretion pathway protein I
MHKGFKKPVLVSQGGFTLIEIMVALGIAAVSIVAIIDAMGKNTWVASELEQRILASWVVSNEIAEIRYDAKISKVKIGSHSNTVEMGGHRWRVKSRIKKTDVERVFLVTVEVNDDARSRETALSTMTTAVTDRL